MWSNSLLVLERLGLRQRLCPLSTDTPMGGAMYMTTAGYRSVDGRWLARPTPLVAGGIPGALFLTEDALLAALIEALPAGVEVLAGRSVAEFGGARGPQTTRATGGSNDLVSVILDDGMSLPPARLLVGADGIDSAVRRRLVAPGASPVLRGYDVYRAVVRPSCSGGAAGVGSGNAAGFAGMEAFQTWGPSGRFAAVPLAGGGAAWFATVATEPSGRSSSAAAASGAWGASGAVVSGALEGGGCGTGGGADGAGLLAALGRRFGHWHSPVAELLAATDPGSVAAEAARSSPVFRWPSPAALAGGGKGGGAGGGNNGGADPPGGGQGSGDWRLRVALVGDALRTLDPVLAQGSGLAVEDAAALASALAPALVGSTAAAAGPAAAVAAAVGRFAEARAGRSAALEALSGLSQALGLVRGDPTGGSGGGGGGGVLLALRDGALHALPGAVKTLAFDAALRASLATALAPSACLPRSPHAYRAPYLPHRVGLEPPHLPSEKRCSYIHNP